MESMRWCSSWKSKIRIFNVCFIISQSLCNRARQFYFDWCIWKNISEKVVEICWIFILLRKCKFKLYLTIKYIYLYLIVLFLKIGFNKRFEGFDGNTFMFTFLFGTDYRIQEPTVFDRKSILISSKDLEFVINLV